MKFSEMTYARPDAQDVKEQAAKLRQRQIGAAS